METPENEHDQRGRCQERQAYLRSAESSSATMEMGLFGDERCKLHATRTCAPACKVQSGAQTLDQYFVQKIILSQDVT